MAIDDFIWFLLMAVYLFIPFGAIYLTLYTLNWNERRSLFFDSWFVFIAWIVSSITAFFLAAFIEHKFYRFSSFRILNFLVPIMILTNIISIAGVLILKVREQDKKVSLIENYENEKIQKISNKKIWLTSVIVSVLTIAVVSSLVIFIDDISNRIDKLYPKPTNEFGIYH